MVRLLPESKELFRDGSSLDLGLRSGISRRLLFSNLFLIESTRVSLGECLAGVNYIPIEFVRPARSHDYLLGGVTQIERVYGAC